MADAKADRSRKPADGERDGKRDDTEAASSPKKSGLKRIALIAGILVVQVIVAYFLQRTFLFPTSPAAEAHSLEAGAKTGGSDHGGGSHSEKGEIVLLDEIIVNPAETGGRRFLAITIGFEVLGDEGLHETEQLKPLVRDGIIGLLSAKRMSELADIAFRDSLREEIRQKIQHELEPLEVPRVFFTGFVLQ
jgi:flagellar FliL protein